MISEGHGDCWLSGSLTACLWCPGMLSNGIVQAPMDGEVVSVLLEEGDPVAYDQELFELVPGMASSGSRIK